MKIRKSLALLVIINLIFLPLRFIQASSFFDVSDDVLFAPYIENLYEQHFVQGYSAEGEFTGSFRPNDPILRQEYAKITVINRLAEQYGVSRNWAEVGEQKVESDLYELLLPYFDCHEGACDKIGGTLYQDVAATDKKCDEGIDGSCEPWFGRYVYYATDKGFIEGFDENGAKYFRPDDNLVRIHSFKMLLVDDFNVPPMEDARFRRLSDMADANNSFTPKCLKGSEAYILANNRNIDGEIDTKTRRILEYSLLADRLDFFGNECQVFSQYGAKTARQRADFLQHYLTRQEAARYFTLSTTYSAVKIAPEEDETVNTETENQNSEAIFPYHTEEALQQAVDQAKQMIQEAEVLVEASKDENDIPTLTLKEALKQVEAPDLGPVLPAKPKAEEVVVNKNELIAEDGLIVDKEGNIYTEDLDVYNEAFYGIDIPEQPILEGNESYTTQAPLTLCTEAGKCTTADPGTDIKFTRINTDEDGTLWQEVSYNGNTYRMLCEEIRTNLCREAMREMKNEPETFGQNQPSSDHPYDISNLITSNGMLDAGYYDGALCSDNDHSANPILNPPVLMSIAGTPYWYTVIPGWQTTSDGLWGGVFSTGRYNKNYLEDTLFPVEANGKRQELLVSVISESKPYDFDGRMSNEEKEKERLAMIKNYRTDRWYKIRYYNPDDPEKEVKTGWVPVSALILKDDIFKITVDGKYIYDYYHTIHNRGYGNTEEDSIDKLLLHNTAGSTASSLVRGINSPPHYYLGREHDLDRVADMDNRFVGYIPEYLNSGTVNYSGSDIERVSISVEMVNWGWLNPSLKTDSAYDREVKNGVFHEFDLEKLKEFAEIKDDNYSIVNYYFAHNGLFEILGQDKNDLSPNGRKWKEDVLSRRETFNKFYIKDFDTFTNKQIYTLNDYYKNKLNSDNSNNEFNEIYNTLNKIPLDYSFKNYVGGVVNIQHATTTSGAYPFSVYSLDNASKTQALTDGKISSYYEKYTSDQYKSLSKFISHMGDKYGISRTTFKYNLPDKIPQKYGFYMYDTTIPWEAMKNNVLESNAGIISHRNSQEGGKMCPAPGFQIDRISSLN